MESFKQRMKRIRQRADYRSQATAATAIGCERGTVGMWEAPSSNVQSVSGEWLFAVARAYKVRPEWINDLKNDDDGYPWSPNRLDTGAPQAQTDSGLDTGRSQLDIGLLAKCVTHAFALFRTQQLLPTDRQIAEMTGTLYEAAVQLGDFAAAESHARNLLQRITKDQIGSPNHAR